MSELSVFIDESGEFGTSSEYYLLTLVFHDQAKSIEEELAVLRNKLGELDMPQDHEIHAGPIVRKEDEYQLVSLHTRRALVSRLYAFTRRIDVSYKTFIAWKKEYPDRLSLKSRLARELSLFLREHLEYFTSFERVIVYYDNGQAAITELVSAVFASMLFELDFRKVKPSKYRLFQSADLFCTLELVATKEKGNGLSRSEEIFFESRRKLKKNYLDKLDSLRFDKKQQ